MTYEDIIFAGFQEPLRKYLNKYVAGIPLYASKFLIIFTLNKDKISLIPIYRQCGEIYSARIISFLLVPCIDHHLLELIILDSLSACLEKL
jgi:hypothetical protein